MREQRLPVYLVMDVSRPMAGTKLDAAQGRFHRSIARFTSRGCLTRNRLLSRENWLCSRGTR